MPNYTLRATKGSALTFTEGDNNFTASKAASRLGTSGILTPPSGVYVCNNMIGSDAMGSAASSVADTIILTPFQLPYDLTIDQVGFWQTSTSGTTDLRVLVYSSDANQRPNSKVAETATHATAANSNTISLSHTFNANTLYWVGTHTSGVRTFRQCREENLMPLGLDVSAQFAPTYAIVLGSTAIGSAPTTWSFAASQLQRPDVINLAFRRA